MDGAGTYNQEQRCPKDSHFFTNIKLVCDLLLGAAKDTAGNRDSQIQHGKHEGSRNTRR